MQVKKKMTCDEFIRNNRGINGGVDLPHQFLRELYGSISQNEIRISADQQSHQGGLFVSPILWTDLAQQSQTPRGRFASAEGAFLYLIGQVCPMCACPLWARLQVFRLLGIARDVRFNCGFFNAVAQQSRNPSFSDLAQCASFECL